MNRTHTHICFSFAISYFGAHCHDILHRLELQWWESIPAFQMHIYLFWRWIFISLVAMPVNCSTTNYNPLIIKNVVQSWIMWSEVVFLYSNYEPLYTSTHNVFGFSVQALLHASVAHNRKLVVDWVPAGDLEDAAANEVITYLHVHRL